MISRMAPSAARPSRSRMASSNREWFCSLNRRVKRCRRNARARGVWLWCISGGRVDAVPQDVAELEFLGPGHLRETKARDPIYRRHQFGSGFCKSERRTERNEHIAAQDVVDRKGIQSAGPSGDLQRNKGGILVKHVADSETNLQVWGHGPDG